VSVVGVCCSHQMQLLAHGLPSITQICVKILQEHVVVDGLQQQQERYPQHASQALQQLLSLHVSTVLTCKQAAGLSISTTL
jgi:hypothetical protein